MHKYVGNNVYEYAGDGTSHITVMLPNDVDANTHDNITLDFELPIGTMVLLQNYTVLRTGGQDGGKIEDTDSVRADTCPDGRCPANGGTAPGAAEPAGAAKADVSAVRPADHRAAKAVRE
jgi:hypothetical protein